MTVSQNGKLVCPSKWTTCLSLKMGNLFVSQNGQLVAPSKWTTHLALKMGSSFVPQADQGYLCYFKMVMLYLFVIYMYKRTDRFSCKVIC